MCTEDPGVTGDETGGTRAGKHFPVEGREDRLRAPVLRPRPGIVERHGQLFAGDPLDEVHCAVR